MSHRLISNNPRADAAREAFTLAEMLAAVAVISILTALLFPAVNRARESAQTAKCGENIRRLAAGIHAYAAENDGNLPYNYYSGSDSPTLWWHTEIAPYLGFSWDRAKISDFSAGRAVLPDIFRCPADPYWKKSWQIDPSYGCNHTLTKTIPHGGYTAGTPRTKLASVDKPASMILLADSGHQEEDGDVAWRIGKTQASQAPLARHSGFGAVAWLDGHATLETAERLRELHSEARPWPHWQTPDLK